ncbi:MAG: hypothetical protein GKR94_19845 [Gammaproteobacteria bacterium]|nr:hypothetical protein [Gammaproteobacteria bacterium]
MPEPHILLMVVQPVASPIPAPMAAWRAGAWPWPADNTLPMMTSSIGLASIWPASMDERSRAALMAAAPSWEALRGLKAPWNPPMGVRAAPVITIASDMITVPELLSC